MTNPNLIWGWYQDNCQDIFSQIDAVCQKIEKEYTRNRPIHFKKVLVRAYADKLEICSQEDQYHGQWDNPEQEMPYSFGYLDQSGMDEMVEVMEELQAQYDIQGFGTELYTFGVAGRHELIISW